MRVSAGEAARLFRRASSRIPAAVKGSEQGSIHEATSTARQMSMGPYSTAQLREMGHPYARRHPNPPQDPGIINYQTGLFEGSWEETPPTGDGDAVRTAAINTAPYSGYLDQGTDLMIRRPLVERVRQAIQPRRLARMRGAISRLFGG